jgi:hypothetical protein
MADRKSIGMRSGSITTDKEELPLAKAAERMLEECRMVLPGIQALFGFQLIAVFNNGFQEQLDHEGRVFHLVALLLVAIAAGLTMAPAAYHRIVMPRAISPWLLRLSTRFLVWSMLPLALGICMDIHLIAYIILEDELAYVIPIALFVGLVLLWFLLPHASRKSIEREEREAA